MMIGVDFHPRFQQIAYLGSQAVRIGVEATENFRWCQRLQAELGQEMLLGDPSEIHASIARRPQTDKRDARHCGSRNKYRRRQWISMSNLALTRARASRGR